MSFCLHGTWTPLFKCYCKTVPLLIMSGGAGEESGEKAGHNCCKGRRLVVPNIEVFLCLGPMIITFKKINKWGDWTCQWVCWLSKWDVTLTEDFSPSATETSRPPKSQKYAVEHFIRCFLDKNQKAMRLITNHKTKYGWIPFSCFHFRYFCDRFGSRKDTLVSTVAERRLIVASCGNSQHCFSFQRQLCQLSL